MFVFFPVVVVEMRRRNQLPERGKTLLQALSFGQFREIRVTDVEV
jgi:hypothetical protein